MTTAALVGAAQPQENPMQNLTAAALAAIAQTARRCASQCLTLADKLFQQGDRDAAVRLVALAEDCRSVARRAEAIGH